MNSYQAAFMNLDPDGPRYLSSNTLDAQSYASFLNAYPIAKGGDEIAHFLEWVDFSGNSVQPPLAPLTDPTNGLTFPNFDLTVKPLLETNPIFSRFCGCLFTFNAFIVPPEDDDLQDFLAERRRSLSKHIRARLARSVREGELPEGANCEALANLRLTLLSGLTIRVLDGAPPGLLFRSIGLFVDALGFRVRRTNLAKKAGN
jgi:hypothetical protein